ncbi:MAG: hypothetical protein JWP00_3141 [Chloroflexi bacterium]|jgi:hypothetical protein|nr:hypothetical protein [Chloroflexota bacterium]
MEKIKVLNGWTNRKETLPPPDPLRVYLDLPLPGSSLSQASPPALSAFPDLTALRVYLIGDLLRRLARRTEGRAKLVDRPEQAQVVVAGGGFRPTGPTGLLVKVASPVQVGELDQFTLDEIRLYLFSNALYTSPLKMSADTLTGARAAFGRLKDYVRRFQAEEVAQFLPNISKDAARVAEWRDSFYEFLVDDLNTPRAIATIWMMLQSELVDASKLALLTDFATVLGLSQGLGLPESYARPASAPERPAKDRPAPVTTDRRPANQFEAKRNQPVVTGFEGRNKPPPGSQKPGKPGPNQKPGSLSGKPAPANEQDDRSLRRINRSQDIRSYLDEPDRYDFTINLIAYNNLAAVQTTVESILKIMPRSARSLEVIVTEMNSSDKTTDYLAVVTQGYANFRVVYAQQNLGEAAGRNVALRQGRGHYLLLLDAGLRLTADYFDELWRELAREEAAKPALFGTSPVKLVRQNGALTGYEPVELDLKQATDLDVEALEGSVLCFRRALADEAGFMDEHFRFPYALGLDYSFGFRDKGFSVKVSPALSRMVERPANFARPVYGLPEEQQDRQRQKNWQLFLRSWQLE